MTQKMQDQINQKQVVALLDEWSTKIENQFTQSYISKTEFQENINKALQDHSSDQDGKEFQILKDEIAQFKIDFEDSKKKLKENVEAAIIIQI